MWRIWKLSDTESVLSLRAPQDSVTDRWLPLCKSCHTKDVRYRLVARSMLSLLKYDWMLVQSHKWIRVTELISFDCTKNQRVKNTVSRFMCTTISLASLKYNDFIGSLCFYSTDKETRGICAVLIMLNYFFKAAEITLNTKIKAARERRWQNSLTLCSCVFSAASL